MWVLEVLRWPPSIGGPGEGWQEPSLEAAHLSLLPAHLSLLPLLFDQSLLWASEEPIDFKQHSRNHQKVLESPQAHVYLSLQAF